ncbi:hypothetical protein [Paenilisteria newyorkensis]|uniref:hypothetical protein n=1 Tax=Listeria newyorkensis TaxID=1497681 RepID=UPI000669D1AE|nr:hypothetical protein [Listeria newyorkensis]KMT62675.1 hypothetical protein X559_0958 [Listeria newyorkensis]
MKTSKFIQTVEELGYKIMSVGRDKMQFRVYNNDVLIAVVNKNKFMESDTAFEEFEEVGESRQLELGSLIFDYASTPVNKRKEDAE